MRTFPLALLLLAFGLSACSDREPSTRLADRAASLSAGMNVDTLVIDGEPTPVQFQEVSGASFPVPFDLRIPRPVRFGAPSDDSSGTAVAFRYGQAPADAQIRVVALPETFDEAAARAEAARLAGTLGAADGPDPAAPSWAAESIATSQPGRTGAVWLGQHGGRWFAVVTDMALEAADGFTPRRDYLLENWTWTDDGSSLAVN